MSTVNNPYTPAKITDSANSIHFSIPLYQRLFAWGPKQVKRLLTDLFSHFAKNPNDDSPYYVGLLTCYESSTNHYDLIDGQQRMSVMMLLGIVMQHYDGSNGGAWSKFLDGGKRINFVARHDDHEYITKRVLGKSDKGYKNEKMEASIQCIEDFMNDKEMFPTSESQEVYALNVYNRITFFLAELPSSYKDNPSSLNHYFEVMNSGGKGLEQHEILKVEMLLNLGEEQKDKHILNRIWNLVSDMRKPIIRQKEGVSIEEYREQYKDAIMTCCQSNHLQVANKLCSSTDNEGQEYLSIAEIKPEKQSFGVHDNEDHEDSVISFPEFLLLLLGMKLGEENKMEDYEFYRTDKLIERFDHLSDITPTEVFKTPEEIKSFFLDMLHYRLLLDYYVIRRQIKDGTGTYTLTYRDRQTIASSLEENKDDKSIHVRQYQSMLYVSTEYYKWLPGFLKFILEEDECNSVKILQYLKASDNIRHPQKDINDFNLSYKKKERYWFWRLDYYLWEQRNIDDILESDQQKIVEKYTFRSNRSLEHLHPQDETYCTEKWDSSNIHSFGNLAMISQAFNSEQSNDNVELKFARIRVQLENGNLQSIKLLYMYQAAHKDESKWNEKTAEIHHQLMKNVLLDSYNDSMESNNIIATDFDHEQVSAIC